jgi:hypothetical protein
MTMIESAVTGTTETAPTTITLPGSALRQLANVALFAAKGKDARPALQSVRLESDGTTVTAVATNSYMLGSEVLTPFDHARHDPFEILLDSDALAPVLKIRNPYTVELAIGADQVTFTVDGRTFGVPAIDAQFPQWRRLLDPPASSELPSPLTIGLAPANLAVLAKIRCDYPATPVVLTVHTQVKAVHVRIGETFTGAVMPVRLPD